jgi:ribosomal protein L9
VEVLPVSIVRIGLAETKKFAEGYEAIFGSKKRKAAEEKPAQAKDSAGKKTKASKKKNKK